MNASSKNIALVTGASGFIGGHLAARLLEEGRPVRLLVRDAGKLPAGMRNTAEVVEGSLADAEALARAVRGVSVVFHCAANVNTWDTPEAYYAANVQGVQNLLDAVSWHNPALARLVHVSTMDVYGFPETPCDEQCKPVAIGFGYGDTKLQGEARVAASGIPHTIIRPGNVIGPGSQFISRIGAELESGLMLAVNGGRAHAGLVYVGNLVEYMLWAARSDLAEGQCYNVRDDYDVTWAEFIASMRAGIEGRGRVLNLPFWAANAAARACEAAWRIFRPGREPLLHRLLVRIFGRTCGHPADKIRREAALQNLAGYEAAMESSIRWFLQGQRPPVR